LLPANVTEARHNIAMVTKSRLMWVAIFLFLDRLTVKFLQ